MNVWEKTLVECQTCGGPIDPDTGAPLEGWPFKWQVASKLRAENERLRVAILRHLDAGCDGEVFELLKVSVSVDHRAGEGTMTDDEEDRFINRLHERIDSVMEACWYAGRRGHPAPNVSKSYGAERGDILRMVRAALKRARMETGDEGAHHASNRTSQDG